MPTTTVLGGLDLPWFDTRQIQDGNLILVVGKKGTGKTTALLDICYRKRAIPDGTVFSGTADSNDSFNGIAPESFIFNGWQPDIVRRIIARQKRINRARKRKGLPKKFTFIIVDDCAYDDSFCKDKQLREIFMNGRWLGIFFIFSMQWMLGIPPALRGQVDWVFVMAERIPKHRDRLFDSFCGHIGNRKAFDAVMNKVTDDFGCLVVKNTGSSNSIQDCFFWYKAKQRNWNENPKLKKWRMGSKAYWAKHYERYNKHWDSGSDGDDDDDDVVVGPNTGRKTSAGAAAMRTANRIRLLPPPPKRKK
jgi:hypothetical protein